jgi:hypothetical protein
LGMTIGSGIWRFIPQETIFYRRPMMVLYASGTSRLAGVRGRLTLMSLLFSV